MIVLPTRDRVRRFSISSASTVALAALFAAGLTSGGALASPTTPGGIGQTTFDAGRYVVTLVDDAIATYEGGKTGLPATKPDSGQQLDMLRGAVQNYGEYLSAEQKKVAAAAGVTIDSSYTAAINAFSADLTSAQAATLSASRKVKAVSPDEILHVTAEPSTSFLGLDGPKGVWNSIGGADKAGRGVVLGVLDTGIAPENPAFAGDPLGTYSGDEPYIDGDAIAFAKGDGQTFRGVCETGEQFTTSDCSTKIVGARYFLDGFGAANLGDETTGPGEFISPRDGDGHGSHTGSTAVGNIKTPVSIGGIDFGTITGVAPAAKIAAYKVCWSGPDPAVTTDDGCATTDLLAGINQAVMDGVDAINYSIGGGSAQTTYSPTDDAFLGAAAAGVFVSASAGNDGPGVSTLGNASPWITTVAASTIPSYEGTVTLGDGSEFAGASTTIEPDEPVTGDLVNSTAYASGDATDAGLCAPDSLTKVPQGSVVVCERGVYARVDKSAEVARVGGIGMVLVNVVPGSVDTDFHSVPTVHLDSTYHDQVVEYAATKGATVTLTDGNLTGKEPAVPQVAAFSSRGPVLADGSDVLKPDIAAPGVSILAAGSNAENVDPSFEFLSGTSMAAPHIAGLGALYLGERPKATPSEVKSAMMTTAYDTLDTKGDPVTDPFTQGAGEVDPTRFFEPGLLYLNDVPDWLSYLQGLGYDAGVDPVDASDLNLASIAVGTLTAKETVVRTVTSTQAGTFRASVDGLDGIDTVVKPSTLNFDGPGETATYSVTFNRKDASLDAFATGSLTWTSGKTTVRSPIAVQPVTIVAPAGVEGTGVTGSVTVDVTPGGSGEIPLTSTGLSKGELLTDPSGTATGNSGSGTTGDQVEYTVEVPEGAEWARFDLDSIDDTADLDLFVNQLGDDGEPIVGFQSATGSADEQVNIPSPEAGTYQVIADVFSGKGTLAWDLTATSVVAGGSPIVLDPTVLTAVQGEETSYSASWADLDADSTYLGLVTYGDTGRFTALQVTTGAGATPGAPANTALPTITGTPAVGTTLTATPGEWDTDDLDFAYQWQADGEDIAGATAETYTVTAGDQGAELTVVVTATSGDLPPGTATSAAVTVLYSSTTSLSLSRTLVFGSVRSTATVKVSSGSGAPATGTVKLNFAGKTVLVPLSSNGTATFTLPELGAGSYKVRADYTGDDVISGSRSGVRSLVVVF